MIYSITVKLRQFNILFLNIVIQVCLSQVTVFGNKMLLNMLRKANKIK